MISSADANQTSKPHFHRFCRFCRAAEHDQQTDKQTCRQTTLLRLLQQAAINYCSFPWGDLDSMVLWAYLSQPQRHFDWFSRFCTAQGTPTDTQTHRRQHFRCDACTAFSVITLLQIYYQVCDEILKSVNIWQIYI